MERIELIKKLNEILLSEMPEYRENAMQFGDDILQQRRLFRSLMNVRMSGNLSAQYIELQDKLLLAERDEKGIVNVSELEEMNPHIKLWRGDITRLNADAIVNAANSRMLGCFCPCHGCIDNAIHSAAGSQLREECARIMNEQGYDEPTGKAKITKAYNLPSKYVIHTVGPIITGGLTEADCKLLKSCYQSCLELTKSKGLKSIAFCCISTGEFHFPKDRACEIAVSTVKEFLKNNSGIEVIFNVFTAEDEDIYRRKLG